MQRKVVPAPIEVRREQDNPSLGGGALDERRHTLGVAGDHAPRPAGLQLPGVLKRHLAQVRSNRVERPEDRMAQITDGEHARVSAIARDERRLPIEDGREHGRIDVGCRRDQQPAARAKKRAQRIANAAVQSMRRQDCDDRVLRDVRRRHRCEFRSVRGAHGEPGAALIFCFERAREVKARGRSRAADDDQHARPAARVGQRIADVVSAEPVGIGNGDVDRRA